MRKEVDFIIFTDGGSRGNPGEAAYGFVVYDGESNMIYEEGKKLGIQTNNYAEYSGVLAALKWIEQNTKKETPTIQFYLDSQLAVMQLTEEWKIKNEVIRSFFYSIKNEEEKLGGSVDYEHVLREKNKAADRMVNLALDNKT